jgi:dipeptidyl aminopeptidase/acylaminoacyl peptidase
LTITGTVGLSGVRAYRITYISDGLRIAGFLIAPGRPGGRWPVLIYNRGGNRWFASISQRDLGWLVGFARRGYLVLASEYRGGPGSQGTDQYGGRDVNDVLNLIRLARGMPAADGRRIFMIGFSRGGLMTYRALSLSGAVRAAVTIGGVSDVVAWSRSRGPRLDRVLRELIGSPISHRNRAYRLRSAVYWAGRIRTPLLLLHGGSDARVPAAQSRALYARLRRAGVICQLVVFPGGDHRLDQMTGRRDRLIISWLRRFGGR